jgi:hypothetical protein
LLLSGEVLDSMGLSSAFNVQLHVPALRGEEVVAVMRKEDSFAPHDIPMVSAWTDDSTSCIWLRF